jgi:hypothetical protein
MSFRISCNKGIYLSFYPSYRRLLSFSDCSSYMVTSVCIARAFCSVQECSSVGSIGFNNVVLCSGGSFSRFVSSLWGRVGVCRRRVKCCLISSIRWSILTSCCLHRL